MSKIMGALGAFLILALLAGCGGNDDNDIASIEGDMTEADVVELQPMTRVSGSLLYRARIALAPDAVALIQLMGATEEDDLILAEQRIQLDGRQVPIDFDLDVDAETLAQASDWRLQAVIQEAGRTRWLSEAIPLELGSGDQALGEVELMPYRDTALASIMNCGQRQIRAGHDGESLVLDVGGERFVLLPVEAASGARYEAKGDPETRFWSKGDQASLTLNGEEYPLCVAQGALPRPLQARGNEPFWRIDLDDRMTLSTPDEESQELAYELEHENSSVTLVHSMDMGMELRLEQGLCRDNMTGMPYPFKAELVRDGETHPGCAGDPEQLLQGVTWTVGLINDEAPLDGSRVTLRFMPEQRLAGVASCNNFMAGYELTGEGLSVQQAATTMKACEASLMEQEQKVLEILQGAQRFDINEEGELVLYSDQGQRLTARQGG